jgi:hypothetical protein
MIYTDVSIVLSDSTILMLLQYYRDICIYHRVASSDSTILMLLQYYRHICMHHRVASSDSTNVSIAL